MTDDAMSQPGTATRSTERSLVVTQHVSAPPDTVFDFLTEPEKVGRWLGAAIDIDPQIGGRFWMDANGRDTAAGLYREVVRPERVVFTFGWEGSGDVPEGSTTVTIELEPAPDDTTLVRLIHDGLPGGPEDSHRHGWTYFLDRLATAARGDEPGPVEH